MTVVDLHPEELLEKEALGELDESERGRLLAHVARCATCRLERQMRADFADDLAVDAPAVRFDALAATQSLLPQEPADEGRRSTLTSLRRSLRPGRRARVTWLLAAAALLVGGVATAMGLGDQHWLRPTSGTLSDSTTVATAVQRAHPPLVAPALPHAPAREEPAPVAENTPPATAAQSASQTAVDVAPVRAALPVVTALEPSPAELLDAESAARRRGDYARVLDLHRRLETQFGSTREAQVSRATVGRLLLDRGDPSGALASFDAYLRTGSGDLREEAMVGRATALERLGRSGEASGAWASLLAVYPSTPYGAHARSLLGLSHGE